MCQILMWDDFTPKKHQFCLKKTKNEKISHHQKVFNY